MAAAAAATRSLASGPPFASGAPASRLAATIAATPSIFSRMRSISLSRPSGGAAGGSAGASGGAGASGASGAAAADSWGEDSRSAVRSMSSRDGSSPRMRSPTDTPMPSPATGSHGSGAPAAASEGLGLGRAAEAAPRAPSPSALPGRRRLARGLSGAAPASAASTSRRRAASAASFSSLICSVGATRIASFGRLFLPGRFFRARKWSISRRRSSAILSSVSLRRASRACAADRFFSACSLSRRFFSAM